LGGSKRLKNPLWEGNQRVQILRRVAKEQRKFLGFKRGLTKFKGPKVCFGVLGWSQAT